MQIDLDKPVPSSAFAKLVGVSRQRIDQLIASGALARGGSARDWLAAYCEGLRVLAATGDDSELTKQRRRLVKARADAADLDLAARKGELVGRSAVVERWGKICASLRARLLLIPNTAAPLVVGKTAAEAEAILTTFVHDSLTELADGKT